MVELASLPNGNSKTSVGRSKASLQCVRLHNLSPIISLIMLIVVSYSFSIFSYNIYKVMYKMHQIQCSPYWREALQLSNMASLLYVEKILHATPILLKLLYLHQNTFVVIFCIQGRSLTQTEMRLLPVWEKLGLVLEPLYSCTYAFYDFNCIKYFKYRTLHTGEKPYSYLIWLLSSM